MSGLGWQNPVPAQVGGDSSKVEDVYRALRGALGTLPGPVDDLEDLWRQAKATAIGMTLLDIERAVHQAFPNHATDHLSVYEKILFIQPGPSQSDEERRRVVTEAWVLDLLAQMPSIQASLQVIDPAFDVDEFPHEITTLVKFGRTMAPRGFESFFGSPEFPNFADDFILRVKYNLGAGQTAPPAEVLVRAKRYLNKVLPGWIDFQIFTGLGFRCDGGLDGTSLLGLKSLGA